MAEKQVGVLICNTQIGNTFMEVFLGGIQTPKYEIKEEERFIQLYNKSRPDPLLPAPLTLHGFCACRNSGGLEGGRETKYHMKKPLL